LSAIGSPGPSSVSERLAVSLPVSVISGDNELSAVEEVRPQPLRLRIICGPSW